MGRSCWVLLLLSALAASGEILDRIAVTVGKQVITESDIIRDLRVTAFLDRMTVDLSPKARREAASRLVDQILILREAADSHFALPTAADTASLVEQQKDQFDSPEEFHAVLSQYGITEADLTERLLAGLRALRFTDLRFRPEIEISDQELRDYYNKLNPAPKTTFEESRNQIEELLTGQREMQVLDKWLETARSQGHVQYREAAFK